MRAWDDILKEVVFSANDASPISWGVSFQFSTNIMNESPELYSKRITGDKLEIDWKKVI